jgi:hypothetical protein
MGDVRASRRQRHRLWAAVLLVVWAGTARCGPGFGAVAEAPLSFTPAALAVVPGPAGARSEIVVVARDQPLLAGHAVTDEGVLVETRTFRPPGPCRAIAQGDFDGDGRREFTLLSSGGTRIHAYLRHPAGWLTRRLDDNLRAARILAADLNADGLSDVLCYGRSMAGGVLYFGTRRGLSDSAVAVLPDVSIADAVATDVNGDGVPDLLVADWLGSAVTLYSGLDGRTFTEALRVGLPDEPREVDLAESSPGTSLLIAVLLGDGSAIRTYTMRPAGEMSLAEVLRLEEGASDLRLADVDGDRRPELLVASRSGVMYAGWTSAPRLGRWTSLGVFPEGGALTIRDVDGDRKRDLIVAEASRRRLVVCANSASSGPAVWPDTYVTPGEPVAAVVADVNLDGDADILVASRRPPALAVLTAGERGMYALEHTVAIPGRAVSIITAPAVRGGGLAVVTSHGESNVLGVVTFDQQGTPGEARTISTADNTRALTAVRDSSTALQILTLTRGMPGAGCGLSWFDELPSGQFVERPAAIPSSVKLVDARAAEGRDTGPILATLLRGPGSEGLSVWWGRPFRTGPVLSGVPSSASARILACDLSDRGALTVYYYGGARSATAGYAVFHMPTAQWAGTATAVTTGPVAGGAVLADDHTGDGISDLLYVDDSGSNIVLHQGGGAAPVHKTIMPAAGAVLAAVGEPRAGEGRDLVIIRKGVDAVTVIRGGVRP